MVNIQWWFDVSHVYRLREIWWTDTRTDRPTNRQTDRHRSLQQYLIGQVWPRGNKSNIGEGSWRTIASKVLIGSIIVPKSKILCGLDQEWESGNQFQWQKIGYNQVKYRWKKLTNNPMQGLDRIYRCAKMQEPMWFGSGMRVLKPECVNWTNERTDEDTNEQISDAGKNNSPTPAFWAGRRTNYTRNN